MVHAFVPNGATLDSPYEGEGCRLFENLGGLRFEDVTEGSGLADREGYGMGVVAGDVSGSDPQQAPSARAVATATGVITAGLSRCMGC